MCLKKYIKLIFIFIAINSCNRHSNTVKRPLPVNFKLPALFIVYNSLDCDKCMLPMEYALSCEYVKKNIPYNNQFILLPSQRASDEQYYTDKFNWAGLKMIFDDSLYKKALGIVEQDTSSAIFITSADGRPIFHTSFQDIGIVDSFEKMEFGAD